MSSSPGLPTPDGPGSVSGAPGLPAGFTSTFTSRYVDTGQLRLPAVTGGEGPPLLPVHGWPQTWYAWRMLMPPLARYFSQPQAGWRPGGRQLARPVINQASKVETHAQPN